jgi:DNA-binding response OmpR family regulator
MHKILIIDDNKYLRFTLSAVLEEYGFNPITAEDFESGFNEIKSSKPDLIILDKNLPDGDGINLLSRIKDLDGKLPIIMLTAYANEINSLEALKQGVFAFLTKPFDNDEIISVIKKALQ